MATITRPHPSFCWLCPPFYHHLVSLLIYIFWLKNYLATSFSVFHAHLYFVSPAENTAHVRCKGLLCEFFIFKSYTVL